MTNPLSNKSFKIDAKKKATSQNIFVQSKIMTKQKKLEGERKDKLKRWITFFRRNPVRFITGYFGIKLHLFQILMIWILQRSNLAYIVAARATSKTFIIAIWAMTLCVLYPGIKVLTCSKTLKQGSLIVGKIKELQQQYPNVAREISSLTINANGAEVNFICGSYIKAVPSSESARGNRANYIIIEESRLVSTQILNSVLKPTLEIRTPPYRLLKEYENNPNLKEEGIISYITSAGFVVEDWYKNVKSCIHRMVSGDETANFLAFDYLTTLIHNIKSEEMLKNEMEETDPATIEMEYYNLPAGGSNKGFFKTNLFRRNMKQAFYPIDDEDFLNNKKIKGGLNRIDGECRFLGIDISTRANKMNDLTIIGASRLIPNMGIGFERHLSYIECFKEKHSGIQSERIKKIFFDFIGAFTQEEIDRWKESPTEDYIVLDTQNAGIGIFDSLSEATLCDERGLTYPPLTVVDERFDYVKQETREELRSQHTRGINAVPVIFPISASQQLNSQIAYAFRRSLQKKMWSFLISETDGEEFLIKTCKEFTSDPNNSEIYAKYLSPYINTTLLISECINLDMDYVGGIVKLKEKSGNYKDRFSAISYLNWIATYFDQSLLKEVKEEDDYGYIAALIQST